MGDQFTVSLREALEPLLGRVATMEVEGEEVTARLQFVNENHAVFKIVPKDTRD